MGQFTWDEINVGTCYYPEHWDKNLWEDDLRRMKAVGIETIRIAEFAWNKVEPEEGVFVYDFWDEFLELAAKQDMKVIFCTPTATPPAWLTEKYPEVLNKRMDGVEYHHGMRCHYNYNSPKYRELSARIVEKLAQHYGPHPSIIGWQIGNEQNCEINTFYSDADEVAFRAFLQNKYADLDALNDAWGTVFWNETYTDWQQVQLPRVTVPNGNNPHMLLDYTRFVSESAIDYTALQTQILRKYIKENDFITTNGLFGNLDNHRMTQECLDVYTYDSYPDFAYAMDADPVHDNKLKDRWWSKNLSETRSICSHFGIMEQQSGPNGWNYRMEAPAPKPGQLTLWAMQSVAHGADFISFFRWRTCTVSTEMYWHGILDYDNRDNRRLAEVKAFSEKIQKIKSLSGAEYVASFGILKDYDNEWDQAIDRWHGRVASVSEQELFVASQLYHAPMDFVDLRDGTQVKDLEKYPVLFYPHGEILTQARVNILKSYVENGGTLVIGARTGQKDAKGHAIMMPMPGLLSEICPSTVEDFTFVGPADGKVLMQMCGERVDSGIFNDVLAAGDGKVLATYLGNYYAGAPALVEHSVGKGRVLHFGGTFNRENLKVIFKYLGIYEPYKDKLTLPEGCEITARRKDGKVYYYLLNYEAVPAVVKVKQVMKSLLNEEEICDELCLAPYGVEVVEVDDNK